MTTLFTPGFLKPYLKNDGKAAKRHPAYDLTCKMACDIMVHSDGDFPKELVGKARPGESKKIQKYREAIYKSKTKGAFGKIMTELMKIRRSEDWSINYKQEETTNREGETLEDYCEHDFPLRFNSVTNWTFNVMLKNYIVDPNSVIAVMPLDFVIEPADYFKPFPIIFSSLQVYDFMEGDYAVLYSSEKSSYTLPDGTVKMDGDIYWLINTQSIEKWEQIDDKNTMKQTLIYQHGLPYMPCFRIGANFFKVYERHFIYESRLSNCIPSFDEAVREYSDLQAEVVQHIHSLMWSYANQSCTKCKGLGKIIREGKDAIPIDCDNCKGSGYVPFNPYEQLVIRPASLNEQAVPIPSAGYIQKDTQIVTIQDKRVRDHVRDGLAAINMEFLADVPLTESGTAKMVDRDALNTFVNAIAEDIVKCMDIIYKMVNDIRYSATVADEEKRDEALPKIPVPDKFDLISSAYLVEELSKAKTSKIHPSIITEMEIEYANCKFNQDEAVRDMLISVYELDPFAGIGEDDKLTRLQNDGISKQDYVISSNIDQFVSRAINEKGEEQFHAMQYEEKRKLMKQYADEIIKANSVQAQVMARVQPINTPPGQVPAVA